MEQIPCFICKDPHGSPMCYSEKCHWINIEEKDEFVVFCEDCAEDILKKYTEEHEGVNDG